MEFSVSVGGLAVRARRVRVEKTGREREREKGSGVCGMHAETNERDWRRRSKSLVMRVKRRASDTPLDELCECVLHLMVGLGGWVSLSVVVCPCLCRCACVNRCPSPVFPRLSASPGSFSCVCVCMYVCVCLSLSLVFCSLGSLLRESLLDVYVPLSLSLSCCLLL